jgi:hypothetical protein
VRMAITGRKREWVRYQGRANAGLFLLAHNMGAEFVEPATEHEFALVRGRTRGCTFELAVDTNGGTDATLRLTIRHFTDEDVRALTGPGCLVPDLDPELVRTGVEDACAAFATPN